MNHRQHKRSSSAEIRGLSLIERVCAVAGDRFLIEKVRSQFAENGVALAVQAKGDGPLYNWMVAISGFQGVADSVARSYWASGGGVTLGQVDAGLASGSCPKLVSFWTFHGCGYRKNSWSCGEPDHRIDCPLPRHDLRNGRLNQAAYSLRLFLRDLCNDDLVGWLDRRLAEADVSLAADRAERLGASVIEPLKGVFGMADKLVSMAMSDLLLGADPGRELWVVAGAGMVAIDTLVHNWLHRTGILASFEAEHAFGAACYGPEGCAALIRRFSTEIDARLFNASYPQAFPRWVQHSVWRFCAAEAMNQCNGVKIDDRFPCVDTDCPVGDRCARLAPFPETEMVAAKTG